MNYIGEFGRLMLDCHQRMKSLQLGISMSSDDTYEGRKAGSVFDPALPSSSVQYKQRKGDYSFAKISLTHI